MNITNPELMVRLIDPEKVRQSYHPYFETIKPVDEKDVFRRGLFALASVHTTWERNVSLYQHLKDLDWLEDPELLRKHLVESRAGLTNNRQRFFWSFKEVFWKTPSDFLKRSAESWSTFRDRVREKVLGLGHAKSSFFVELCGLHEAEVACADTHFLQMYGLRGNQSHPDSVMDRVESHWVSSCRARGLSPVAARWHLWDVKQGFTSPRYWSFCLEPPGLFPV